MRIFERRIGRMGFALGYLPVLGLVACLVQASGSLHWHPRNANGYILLTAMFLWTICLTAWRCHDYGKSAWSNFWTEQLPILGSVLGLWDLVSKPGDPCANAYGPVPKV